MSANGGDFFDLAEADPAAPEAAELISALDADLRERYPGLPIHGIDPAEFRSTNGVFLLGRIHGIAVACGAIRPLSDGAAELKRMFVRSDHRGRGFAKAILKALERIATGRGYQTIRLETGVYQPEAIALYESAGYHGVPCFGEYASEPRSRCFEKSLAETAGVRFVEWPPGLRFLRCIEDAGLIVEACFSAGVQSALLYAPNLTDRFFDLSSGEAGAILQKLRNYQIRLAVVYTPGSVRFSSRFAEMAAEESAAGHFRLFESAAAAREWLSGAG